ncbi:MAG: hypothetical protein ACOYL5_11680 [Phototrophicaceae bacterium]|jgi:hypothetical protein
MSLQSILAELPKLSKEEREQISQVLVSLGQYQNPKKKRSLMELEGLGAEIWQGIDAQDYVNELRDEWDRDSQV